MLQMRDITEDLGRRVSEETAEGDSVAYIRIEYWVNKSIQERHAHEGHWNPYHCRVYRQVHTQKTAAGFSSGCRPLALCSRIIIYDEETEVDPANPCGVPIHDQ